MTNIDLNADLGEGDSCDAELLTIVTSCNIACGGHAGDHESMRQTVAAAIANGVAIGAHPSYPDKDGFGRRSGYLRGEGLRESLIAQIGSLAAMVDTQGASLTHVKPHGALYNDAAVDAQLARVVVDAIATAAPGAAVVALANSELDKAAAEYSARFVAEGFIDRAYDGEGQLLPRSEPGALHRDLDTILSQALALVDRADTLCIHGDTPDAADVARATREELERHGIAIRAVGR